MNKEALRKPNKERIAAALRGEITDRVPNFEVAIEDQIVEKILGKNIGSTLAASRGASDKTLFSPPMDPREYLKIIEFTGQDVIGFEALWTPLKYADHKGELHVIEDGRIKNFEELEKAIKPDWEHDFGPRKRYFDQYKEALKGTNAGMFFLTGCIFQSCYQFLAGFNDFFLLLYTDREFAEALMDTTVDYYLKMIDIALDAGITFLFLGDDIAFKQGTFLEPGLFKEVWLPRYKKLIKPAKEAGVPILFHSCGNLTNIFENVILEMDVEGINPIEPYSMDIYDVKAKYGDKITICGNIDIAGPLAFGTPDEVRAEVREHCERLMPGARYICSTNHSIMNGLPFENFVAMNDAILEYGRY